MVTETREAKKWPSPYAWDLEKPAQNPEEPNSWGRVLQKTGWRKTKRGGVSDPQRGMCPSRRLVTRARYQCAGSHHGRSHPWQGHVEEPWQVRLIMAQGTPWICSSIHPKTRICLSDYFVPFTNSSDINRGYPRPPFSGKNQLRALVNGHDRSISIQTPLMAFPDRFIHTLAINTHDCSQLPKLERHGKPKHSKSPNEHRVL